MSSKIQNVIASFFARRLTRQVRELYSSTLILDFAFSIVSIFEPVFLYLIFAEKFKSINSIQLVLAFYLIEYLIYFFIMPLGAKFARRFGYEYSIAASTVCIAVFYLFLFGIERSLWFIPGAIITEAFWRAFYWPAYHSDFAKFSVNEERGRQISNLGVMESLVYVVGPIAGGLIVKIFGFNSLFVVAAALILASNIPMLITKEKFRAVPFDYTDAYKRLFKKENRRQLIALLGFGEELIGIIIWPIFIFVVVNDFLGLGALTAISILITTLVLLYIGKITDSHDRQTVLRYGTTFYFFSWLFRLWTRSIFGIFLVDAYSRIAERLVGVPIMALTYERAQKNSVMTSIIFFEMSLVLGKILMMTLAILLLFVFDPGWNVLFIISGLATLLYLLF